MALDSRLAGLHLLLTIQAVTTHAVLPTAYAGAQFYPQTFSTLIFYPQSLLLLV